MKNTLCASISRGGSRTSMASNGGGRIDSIFPIIATPNLERSLAFPSGTRAVSLWVYTDGCDALVERLRAAGATVTEEPTNQPWGERTARVLDRDGNEVIIGTRATE